MKIIKKHKAYILGVYAFLILVHFVFKDYIFPISILFYASPLIMITALGLFVSWLYRKKRALAFTLIGLSSILFYN